MELYISGWRGLDRDLKVAIGGQEVRRGLERARLRLVRDKFEIERAQ